MQMIHTDQQITAVPVTGVCKIQPRNQLQPQLQPQPHPKPQPQYQTQELRCISDSKLYGLCKEYGKSARKWMREFGFLLPEVYRRRLYRKYRCTSIHMFAAKLAGMNHDVVSRILNLSEKLKDTPLLWHEFRRFGWTKLRVIADIAESTSEKFWLDKLRKLPTRALEEYVRQWKNVNNKNRETGSAEIDLQNNLFDLVHYEKQESENFSLNKAQSSGTLKLVNEITDGNVATDLQRSTMDLQNKHISDFQKNNVRPFFKKLKFRVDQETEFEFKKFKQGLEKERGMALTMGETLKALLGKVPGVFTQKVGAQAATSAATAASTAAESTAAASAASTVATSVTSAAESTAAAAATTAASTADVLQKSAKVSRRSGQSRHIPNQQKRSIIGQCGGKCTFPGCNEPYFELHHPDRFSINKSHERIYPLCKFHHQAAHAGLIKNEDRPVEQWGLDYESCGRDGIVSAFGGVIDPKNPNSVCVAYEKFRKNFADARVRKYFDG